MNLCDELTIRMLLERHGFHFSKSMGQNFLIDPQIPADIAAAAQADETCGVLEIGPGIGALSHELCRRAGRVVAVELDKALLPMTLLHDDAINPLFRAVAECVEESVLSSLLHAETVTGSHGRTFRSLTELLRRDV